MTLYSYDISSAYPYHASQLLDLRDCKLVKTTDQLTNSQIASTNDYGFLVGDFTVYPDSQYAYCSPFLADRGDGTLVNFVGTAYNYPCLLDEVRTLYLHRMGEFHLKHGWLVVFPDYLTPLKYPFRSLMSTFYSQRNGSDLSSYIIKRVMTGIVGKLLESRKDKDGNVVEYGQFYNPIYHAICTTRTRLQVFQFIVGNNITKDELVFVGVDGVKATRYIPFPSQAPMGEWRYAGSEPTVVLSPGAVLTLDRNYKRTGFAELVVECLQRPVAHKLGQDKNDPIDLRRLFLNQTREFSGLPRNAESLLGEKFVSEPIQMTNRQIDGG